MAVSIEPIPARQTSPQQPAAAPAVIKAVVVNPAQLVIKAVDDTPKVSAIIREVAEKESAHPASPPDNIKEDRPTEDAAAPKNHWFTEYRSARPADIFCSAAPPVRGEDVANGQAVGAVLAAQAEARSQATHVNKTLEKVSTQLDNWEKRWEEAEECDGDTEECDGVSSQLEELGEQLDRIEKRISGEDDFDLDNEDEDDAPSVLEKVEDLQCTVNNLHEYIATLPDRVYALARSDSGSSSLPLIRSIDPVAAGHSTLRKFIANTLAAAAATAAFAAQEIGRSAAEPGSLPTGTLYDLVVASGAIVAVWVGYRVRKSILSDSSV